MLKWDPEVQKNNENYQQQDQAEVNKSDHDSDNLSNS